MRVGVSRSFDLYRRLGLRPTLSISARVCEEYERVAAEARDAGGRSWAMHTSRCHPQGRRPRAMVQRSMNVLEGFTGESPIGWLGPGLTPNLTKPPSSCRGRGEVIGDWLYDDSQRRCGAPWNSGATRKA